MLLGATAEHAFYEVNHVKMSQQSLTKLWGTALTSKKTEKRKGTDNEKKELEEIQSSSKKVQTIAPSETSEGENLRQTKKKGKT